MLNRQRGVAGFVLVLILLLTASALLAVSKPSQGTVERERVDRLLRAKHALIAYAVNYAHNYGPSGAGPGHLPCPDIKGQGSPTPCKAGALGLMPRQFAMGNGKRSDILAGDFYYQYPIWYQTAPAFRNLAPQGNLGGATIVNPAVNALLAVDGLSDVVAVLIDPGVTVADQERLNIDQGGFTVEAYLEGENGNQDMVFAFQSGNDIVVPIRRAEFMPLVRRWVASWVYKALRQYQKKHGVLPVLAPLGQWNMDDGATLCAASQRIGFLSTPAYRHSAWQNGWFQGDESQAKTVEMCGDSEQVRLPLPRWFVANFWHHHIVVVQAGAAWNDCDSLQPVLDGEEVAAIVIASGKNAQQPDRFTLNDYLVQAFTVDEHCRLHLRSSPARETAGDVLLGLARL